MVGDRPALPADEATPHRLGGWPLAFSGPLALRARYMVEWGYPTEKEPSMPLDYDHRFMDRDFLHRTELRHHLVEHGMPEDTDTSEVSTWALGDAHQLAHASHHQFWTHFQVAP